MVEGSHDRTARYRIDGVGVFRGGPTLIDLLVDVTELRITVTGPRMLFERLELVTTLSAFDGCTVQRLRELAGRLEGTIHCGLVGVQHAGIQVQTLRSGGSLQIDLGPASRYQSELVLRTRTGETLRALVQRLLASDPSRPFGAGLHAATRIAVQLEAAGYSTVLQAWDFRPGSDSCMRCSRPPPRRAGDHPAGDANH